MSGPSGKWRCCLLPLLILSAATAGADPTTRYLVRGPAGAALWGLGDQPGTEAVVLAFTQEAPTPAAPAPEKAPPPGLRLAFSVTQWAMVDGEWVRRQWYGDAPLPPELLVIAADLGAGQLDATVPGTLEEESDSGTVRQRAVSGRLQVQWTGSGPVANTTMATIYQTEAFAATLQTAGSGRRAQAQATVTIDGLAAPIALWGFGSLLAVTSGQLSVTAQ